MTDWQAIRTEYEQGTKLCDLIRAHDVKKTTLIDRRNKEGWIHPTDLRPTDRPQNKIVPIHPSAMPPDAVTIASNLLADLATLVQGGEARLDYSEHVKASRALSEYVKVLIVAPREMEAQDVLSIPLNKILPRFRLAIQQLLDENARAQEQEHAS